MPRNAPKHPKIPRSSVPSPVLVAAVAMLQRFGHYSFYGAPSNCGKEKG